MSAASMAGVLAWMTAAAGTIASFAASLEHNWVTAGAAVVSAIFAGTIYTVNRKQLKRFLFCVHCPCCQEQRSDTG
jgi:hypothetical protein